MASRRLSNKNTRYKIMNPYSCSDTKEEKKQCETCSVFTLIFKIVYTIILILVITFALVQLTGYKAHINIQIWKENQKIWDSWK